MSNVIRDARASAGLTQQQLAERMGTTQSAVARLERADANPRLDTLRRALEVCDMELMVDWRPRKSSIDETLTARCLRIPPAERIKSFERGYADVRQIALAGRRARGELD
jgi:transcriptional regulator with XRE-family HTH domain